MRQAIGSCAFATTLMAGARGIMKEWEQKAGLPWRIKETEEIEARTGGTASSIPCRTIGIALGGGGVVVSSTGLATVRIPGFGETMLLVGGGIDLAGVTADLLSEKGV